MTELLLYSDSVLTVTARPTAAGTPQAQWIVRFVRRSPKGRKMLDQCAAWNPNLPPEAFWRRWDWSRWRPIGSHLVSGPALAFVERWLEGRPVEGEP